MAEAKRQHDWNVASTIMALMAEMNRDRKRRRKPFKPDDFNPYADKKPIVAAERLNKLLRCSVQTFNQELQSHHVPSQSWRSLRRADREEHAVPQGLEAAQKRLKSFGASTRLVGTKLMGLGIAAAAPIGGSLAAYTSFDDAIRAAGAAANATGESFESLRNTAKHLGATTSFSATEVANLMTELGRAGFSPKQIEEMTLAVMNLARATGTDATLSSGIMAATIRQFSLEASDAVRVADGLTAAANKSFNSVESLGEALSYAGPVAADANMSLEETLAILGTLGNLGIQGSEAGTALRRLLTLGAAESEKFQKVFGVATKDAQGNARNLVDILGEVSAATANMGSADRAAAFNEVFGLLGITSASAIGKTVTDTRQLLAELQNSGGIAAKTAADMEAGIGGAFRILRSSVEGVAIAIGEALDVSVTSMMKSVARALSGLTEWIGKNQEVVKKVALIVAGVVGVGAAFIGIGSAAGVAAFAVGGLASMFSLVGTAIGILVSMVGALFTPLGLVIAAVAALGGYFLYSSGIAGQAIEYLKGIFETLKADTIKALARLPMLLLQATSLRLPMFCGRTCNSSGSRAQPISKASGPTSQTISPMSGETLRMRSVMY